ncbi:LOW QUALITY PROTEIN: uncharacterized protein LOC143342849 [Colletes latitarsis]|uniref:LOW QUALITY PROTEIN: uncharacterized protein LOC143342849 n=1 Tax=Colletes latitarsis TaxID=2605962 RepID=UPI004035214C
MRHGGANTLASHRRRQKTASRSCCPLHGCAGDESPRGWRWGKHRRQFRSCGKEHPDRRERGERLSTSALCKFAHEVHVVPERPPRRPRRRRLSGGIRESEIAIITGGTDRESCNTVVGRRCGLPTGAYRYTQALCRTEVEYGLYWRHLLHG